MVWNDLPIAFNTTNTIGLGFYNRIGFDPANIKFDSVLIIAASLELGILFFGLFVYIRARRKW